MGRYSRGDEDAVAPFGIGVILALRQQGGKLPHLSKSLKMTANLGARIVAIFLRKEERIHRGRFLQKNQDLEDISLPQMI